MKGDRLFRDLTERAGLHTESFPGITLLELSGDDRVLVENHRRVMGYTPQCILLRTNFGKTKIEGEHLVIASMERGQLLIRGRVRSVLLEEG